MNRYAVYYRTSRTVVKAATEHDAYQKVAVLFGIEPTHAHKACRAFFLREDHNVNPATGVATNPNTMSKKKTNTMSKKTAPKAPKPMDIGTKVMKIHKAIKAKEKAEKAASKPTLGDRLEKAVTAPKKAPKPAKEGMSGLDAAALVLREAKRPMTAKDIVAEIQERNLAPKLGGKTPHATIYAAMITEISKSLEPRFQRGAGKGTFQHNPAI